MGKYKNIEHKSVISSFLSVETLQRLNDLRNSLIRQQIVNR